MIQSAYNRWNCCIIPGDGTEAINEHHEIVLCSQGGGLQRISHLHHSYLALHHVLLFPQGEEGWHLNIPLQNIHVTRSKYVTQTLYYAFRLHTRPPEIDPSNIFRGGRLFQQYVCDAWASVEQSKLTWVFNNQKKIRSELYGGLQDRLAQDPNLDLHDTGRSVVLPSSHSGSPHYMQQLLQDSLAICRDCKKPDLFLTMTANPTWPEIADNLLPGKYVLFLYLNFPLTCITTNRSDSSGSTWLGSPCILSEAAGFASDDSKRLLWSCGWIGVHHRVSKTRTSSYASSYLFGRWRQDLGHWANWCIHICSDTRSNHTPSIVWSSLQIHGP